MTRLSHLPRSLLTAALLAGALALPAQNAPTPAVPPAAAQPGLLKDPRAILSAAAPFYDFNDPSLKPWHLKATYQLYDETGKPTEQGTFEYWWASPKVYRSTWTRPGASHTDWQTADGKHLYSGSGERLEFFEYKLQSALLSPLPEFTDLDPAKFRLQREEENLGLQEKSPCVMVIPIMPQHGHIQEVPMGLFPTYCFDSHLPVVRAIYSFGTLTMEFQRIAKIQNHFLPFEFTFIEGKREILSAKVDQLNGIALSDAALVPPTDAQEVGSTKADLTEAITTGMLIKKQTPIYPQDAKDAHASGKVVLQATIGVDGAVHDLHVIEAPWPSLAASAIVCASKWEYRPYLLNGQPVEVNTTINVIFTMN